MIIFQHKRRNQTPSPFGLTELDELGPVSNSFEELALLEAVSNRPSVAVQPNRAFVGNVVGSSRYRMAGIIAAMILSVFLTRAGWLQIANGETYRQLADANRTRTTIIAAQRGVIADRNGIELAKNTPSFTLIGRQNDLPDEAIERAALFTQIAGMVQGNSEAFETAYQAAEKDAEFILMLDVPYERALAFSVEDENITGVDITLGEKRSYLTADIPTLSHVLGYTGIINAEEYAERKSQGYVRYDRLGKQGIEYAYETQLRGTFGKEITEVDAEGDYLRTISKADAVNGERLTLTIDARLQKQIEYVIEGRLQGTVATKAAVVAMNPQNGEVLALASWPAYDANLFAQGIDSTSYAALLNDERRPLFPRATSGEYPAGSTIKPIYGAAALTEGIVTPQTSFLSSGGLRIGDRWFPDWRAGGHGTTNLYHAIADSVNTYFYYIGGGYDTFQGMGIDKLMQWAAAFGFGSRSGLDLPAEADGFLPSKAWKESEKGEPWYIGDTYNVSIGQGDFLVSPLQVARATSVFANGGNLVTPHLNIATPAQTEKVIEPDIAAVVKDAMRRTVTQGSATSLQSVPAEVAGKTGTAQWSRSSPPHSWFTGFAPFENPEITITVIVEDGGDASLAIPIAREVLTWYFSQ